MILRIATYVLLVSQLSVSIVRAVPQETEAATRQYAVAAGFQNQKLFGDAIEEWQAFLATFPTDPRAQQAQHYLGTCCLQEKQYSAAIAAFNKAVGGDAEFELLDQSTFNLGVAWYGQAQQSSKDSDYTNAEKTFADMLTKFPSSDHAARALYYRGESLFQLKQVDRAVAAYSEFVSRYPSDELTAEAMYGLGTAQEILKKPGEAEATFAAFTNRFPESPLVTEVQMRRAEMMFDAGKFVEASPIFESISGNKTFELADVAMLRHARCLYETGQLSVAGRLYWNVPREFKSTKHYDAAILAGAKCYFLDEQYRLARTGLEQLAKRDVPEAPEAAQWLARCFIKEGDSTSALRVAERAMKRFTGKSYRPELDLAYIDALYELPSERPKTAKLYADFSRKNAKHELAAQAQYMAALTSLDLKQFKESKSYCEQFLQQYSDNSLKPDVLFIIAENRLLLGEYGEAVKSYQDFLQASPAHGNAAQAKVRLGLALLMAGKPEDSIRWLDSVVVELSDRSLRGDAFGVLGRSHSSLGRFDIAAEMLEKAIADCGDPSRKDELQVVLAEAYRKLGQADKADAQLQAVIKASPTGRFSAEARFRLAESSYANEKYKDAIQLYQDVFSSALDGEFAEHAMYGHGWTLFKLGEYEAAIEAMSKLIAAHGKSKVGLKGYYVRAMAEYQSGDFAGAIRDVDAFVATRPDKNDLLDAQYVKGLSLARLEKFDQAADTYQNILVQASGYPAADKVAYELGWAHFAQHRTDDAVAAFSRLAKDWPESPLAAEALFRVGEVYYEANRFAEAVPVYQSCADKAADGEIAEKSLHKLGWSLMKSKDVTAASSAFTRQLQRFPQGDLSGDAAFLVGECSFQKEDWAAALKAYEQVASANNGSYVGLAMFRAGECAASLEDWKVSAKWHQKVLSAFPDFDMKPEARYGLAWALQNDGKLDEAMPMFEQVTEETQTETAAKARFMIGECLFAQKKHKDATKNFLKAAFLYNHQEWSAMAYFEAARCFEVLRDTEQARSCYEQLIAKYPQHNKVSDAKRRLAELGGL